MWIVVNIVGTDCYRYIQNIYKINIQSISGYFTATSYNRFENAFNSMHLTINLPFIFLVLIKKVQLNVGKGQKVQYS